MSALHNVVITYTKPGIVLNFVQVLSGGHMADLITEAHKVVLIPVQYGHDDNRKQPLL